VTPTNYAESFQGQAHLDAIVSEAQDIVSHALKRE
jgi:phosphoglucomutase